MLPEMKKRQLRVLILFQPLSGSGKDTASIGDILDDFVRQRFGEDSYERVDGIGTVPSKKQTALNNFNNKDMGRFIFLLEYRACLPSIKLSSIDSIIVFDSDWNPANDIRALQKITIDSQPEQIMIFRLYTSWTLEEKILRLAEQHTTIDSKLQNLSRSTSDALLMWGAPYLFNKLAEFHSASVSNISSEESFWNELMEEFLNLILHKCKSKDTAKSIITRAQQSCGNYSKNLPLPKTEVLDGEKPHAFWRKLLEGKNPCWKYLSVSAPRQRKRPQYFEESPKITNAGDDKNVGSKRKKTVNIIDEPVTSKTPMTNAGDYDMGIKRKKAANNVIDFEPAATKPVTEGASEVPANDESQAFPGGSLWSVAIHDETSFRQLLKLNISKLCKVLKLSEDIKIMAERFLEYVIENYRVNKEPANTLQAFLISLCWIGAALLKHKLDRKQSLALAKKHLHFSCKEQEANSVYLKLEPAKGMFLRQTKNQNKTNVPEDSILAAQETSIQSSDPKVVIKVEVQETLDNQHVDDERILMELGQSKIRNLYNEKTSLCSNLGEKNKKEKNVEDVRTLLEIGQSEIQKLLNEETLPSERERRKENLSEKKKNEIEKFNKQWDEKRALLENGYKVDKDFICVLHNDPSVRAEMLKSLDKVFASKLVVHEKQREICLRDLKAIQLAVEGWTAALSDSEHENPIVVSGASDREGHESPKNLPGLCETLTEVQSQCDTEEIPGKKNEGISTDVAEKVDSNKEMGEVGTIVPEESHGRLDQNDTERHVGCTQENGQDNRRSSGGSYSPSADVSKEKEPLVQPVSPASGQSVPTNPEIQTESIQNLEAQGNPNSLLETNNPRPIDKPQVDHFNSEDSSHEPREEPNPAQNAHGDLALVDPSDHTMLQPSATLETHFVDRVDRQPPQNPDTPPQVPTPQPQGPNLLTVQRPNNHNQSATRMQNQSPFPSDPLQAELEKLCEVNNNLVKYHEDIKQKLKSDHEKELAEIIAQINRKYEVKRQDAEVAFRVRKKEVEISLNRVVMNKILAEAFRSKCQDSSPFDTAGIQRVTQPGSLQHPWQFPVRQPTGVGSQQVTMPQPPLLMVHQPSELFSTTPARPPPNPDLTTSSGTPTRPPPVINPVTTTSTPRPPPVVNPITTSPTPTRPPPMVNPITFTSTPRPPPVVNPIATSPTPTRPPPIVNPTTPSRTPRPPPVVSPATAASMPRPPPIANPITTSPRPQPVVSRATATATVSSTPRPLPVVNPITASTAPRPPPPVVNPTTTSSTPRPPPHINPIAARNLRSNGEIRAPAPHIRPFRPSTSAYQRVMPTPHSSSSLPPPSSPQPPPPPGLQPPPPSQINHNHPPTQNSPTSLPASSPLPTQPPPLPPAAPPATSSSLPPFPSIPITHSGLYATFPMPETGSNILTLPALELLMNVDDWAAGQPPPDPLSHNKLPCGNEGGAPPNNSFPDDLVCLSDDD